MIDQYASLQTRSLRDQSLVSDCTRLAASKLIARSKECQRRKVKCDGQSPCARCTAYRVHCEFTPTNSQSTVLKGRNPSAAGTVEPRASTSVPSQGSVEATLLPVSASPHAPSDPNNVPEFSGPSSTEYVFNAVNGNLQAMGMQSAIPDKYSESRIPVTSSGRLAQYGPFMRLLTMDPLWEMSKEDAHVLIDDWCDGLGTVYPIISRTTLQGTAERVFQLLQQAHTQGVSERGESVAEALFNHDTNKLKIVLAIGITKAAGGRDHQAQRLFQSTSEAIEGLIWNPEGMHGIQLLYLVVSRDHQQCNIPADTIGNVSLSSQRGSADREVHRIRSQTVSRSRSPPSFNAR